MSIDCKFAMDLEIPNIRQMTLDMIAQVPEGKITTFRALALALGDSIASRAVGMIIADAEPHLDLPFHRVVYSNGQIGITKNNERSRLEKIELLRAEGIPIAGWRVQNLSYYVHHSFECGHPLKRLSKIQSELSTRVVRESLKERFETAGGVDLSYENYWRGVGAYVEMDIASCLATRTETGKQEIHFPYISTYLAYRELPILISLLNKARESGPLADVILVDGTGILHPRHAGIASQLGIIMDVPTIGITKTKLYGSVALRDMGEGEVRNVIDPIDGAVIGAAIKTKERAAPIYVSTGHGISLDDATQIVLNLARYKLPEPIHRAHNLCKEVATRNRPKVNAQKSLEL